jgi:hypothetical protein
VVTIGSHARGLRRDRGDAAAGPKTEARPGGKGGYLKTRTSPHLCYLPSGSSNRKMRMSRLPEGRTPTSARGAPRPDTSGAGRFPSNSDFASYRRVRTAQAREPKGEDRTASTAIGNDSQPGRR